MNKKNYSIWCHGETLAVVEGVLKDVAVDAKKLAVQKKRAVFVCRESGQGSKPLIGYTSDKGKAVKLKKEDLPELFEMASRVAARGGRPRATDDGSSSISVSVPREEKAKFDHYAERFAEGNRSEMFRRMFTAWEKMMVQVVGEQEKGAA